MREGIKETQMAERTAVQVLVVDDFRPWQHFVGGHLRGHPDIRIVSIASNVLEAMQKAHELQPDLVLLDVGLAELNGIPTARKILEVAPRSAVLFLSERSKLHVEHTALTAGVQGYILKSKQTRDLRRVMKDLLHGPSFVIPAAAGCEGLD